MNEIKEINKWRDIPSSRTGRPSIVKMSVFPNWIYRFSAITIKILASYFADTDKLILKFIYSCKRPRRANTILKNNKVGGLTLLNFKTYYKATVLASYYIRNEE